MIKLTKVQLKDKDRIDAWLKGEPFKENSRDKHPQVPQLTTEQVFEQFVPEWIQENGAYFTPLDMGLQVMDHISIPLDELFPPHTHGGLGNGRYG